MFKIEVASDSLLTCKGEPIRIDSALPRRGWYVGEGKRALDLAISLPGLAILSPLLLVLAAAVALFMGRPVLFRQERPGYRGRPFTLYKFRTMTDARAEQGNLLPDTERLTWVGRRLRAWSLDELPTLWNVLVGDMSLVGPRPLLMQYLDRYTQEQSRRHEAKPGITGWAQVNGRNALTWEEKFRLDVWYVDHTGLWLDIKILWMTLLKVLRREGISASGCATMPEFTGTTGANGRD
jgi:sugar transferase EpsL